MAKNKSKVHAEEAVEAQSGVTYEEEVGGTVEGEVSGAQGFLEKYRNVLLIVLAVVVGAVAYFVYSSGKTDEKNIEALGEMAMAEVTYQQDSIQQAVNGGPNFLGFQAVADDYSGIDAANIATYYTGVSQLELGQIDAGIASLESFEKGANMVSAAAYAALGYAYEQKGDFAEAANQYKKASTTPEENGFSTPFYLMHTARNQESAGDSGAALSTYKRIRDEFPGFEESRSGNIEKYIAKLSS